MVELIVGGNPEDAALRVDVSTVLDTGDINIPEEVTEDCET